MVEKRFNCTVQFDIPQEAYLDKTFWYLIGDITGSSDEPEAVGEKIFFCSRAVEAILSASRFDGPGRFEFPATAVLNERGKEGRDCKYFGVRVYESDPRKV